MDENLEQVPGDNVKEYSEVELKAMDMGWRPREEFNGADDDFIDAKEYVNRKPLFDKIEYQSKELKAVKRALESLKTHYTKVQETEYERALTSLKAQRKEALSQGDGDKFDAVDDQIKHVETQAAQIKAIQNEQIVQEPSVHPEFQSWMNRNNWYNTTQYMRSYADEYGSRLAAQGLEPSKVLVEVEKAVKKEFPHKFRNPNKDDAPDVGDSRTSKSSGQRPADDSGLTDVERKIMNDLVRTGVMSKEKYLADLKAVKNRN